MGPAASSLVTVLAVCALWGCCATAFNVAFQAELIKAHAGRFVGRRHVDLLGPVQPRYRHGYRDRRSRGFGSRYRLDRFVGGAIAVVGVILAITVLFPAIRRAKPVA